MKQATASNISATAPSDHASRAGELLPEVRTGGATGCELEDLGDRTSDRYLVDELTRRFHDDGLPSEESPDDGR